MTAVSQSREPPLYLHVSDPPYESYFYADRDVSCHALLASPLPRTERETSALHRLLFAWPGGNSGAAVFFKALPGEADGNLCIKLTRGSHERVLDPVKYDPDHASCSEYPRVGVSGLVEFSSPAILSLAILGSVRTVRDYTEGHGILNPKVQDGIRVEKFNSQATGICISRLWFDGRTSTRLTFAPANSTTIEAGSIIIAPGIDDNLARFAPGIYSFQALVDFPQTPFVQPTQLLKPSMHHLISLQPDAVKSLSFLCTQNKLLAGAWRFFTYFGRDTLISLLLLSPILSGGEHGAIEAGLSSVLERIDIEDGSVCHEENIGDYPAAQAALDGDATPGAQYDYKMVDTDFFLPIVMKQYLIENPIGQKRLVQFLRTSATLIPSNVGKTYSQLLSRTCQRILDLAKPFSEPGGHTTYKNLIALKKEQPVGQWRDSNNGLGGGRYPFDVNTALMPAALGAIAELARVGGFDHQDGWDEMASRRAAVWEKSTLEFFTCTIPQHEAQRRLEQYTGSGAFHGPSGADQIDRDLSFEAVALREDGSRVEIMHTDICFRLLLLPHLIHSPDPVCVLQHLNALDALATSILRNFPAGLFTPVGVLIANPAYSSDQSHAQTFTRGAYHGTVVWTWNSLAMLAKGFEVQLSAMDAAGQDGIEVVPAKAAGGDLYNEVRTKMKRAYGKVWDTIEASKEHSLAEVWSWRWDENAKGDGESGKDNFAYVPLSHLSTPDGERQTESNVRQLWSLAILALQRRRELEA